VRANANQTKAAAGVTCMTTPEHHPVGTSFTITTSCKRLTDGVTKQVDTCCTTHTHSNYSGDDWNCGSGKWDTGKIARAENAGVSHMQREPDIMWRKP